MKKTSSEILEMISETPMSRWQIAAAICCAFAIMSDGYDTVSMSLAAPFVIDNLGLLPTDLGLVFSAIALGMVCGGLLASTADHIGRRRVILLASGFAGVMMLFTGFANSTIEFVVLRFLTGCAVGAMVTCLNVVVIEYANKKSGGFYLSLVHVGIGSGVILGSALAALSINTLGWRWIFYSAGILNLVVCFTGYFLMPESVAFLLSKQPRNALERINKTLKHFGKEQIDSLPEPLTIVKGTKVGWRVFMTPVLMLLVLLLAAGSFAHFIVGYFHNSWAPKLLIDAGLSAQVAVSSGMVAGVGSLLGNIGTGLLCARYDSKYVTAGAFGLGAIGLVGFGFAEGHMSVLLISAGVVSMFSSATNTGVYLTAARAFPAGLRGTGVGLVVAIGRVGAVFGPIIGGTLIGLGWERSSYYPIFAAIYLMGGVAMYLTVKHGIPKED